MVIELPSGCDNKTIQLALTVAIEAHVDGQLFLGFVRESQTDRYACVAIMPNTSGVAKVNFLEMHPFFRCHVPRILHLGIVLNCYTVEIP